MSDKSALVPSKTSAFLKGGCGCLGLFVVAALVTVLFGGHAWADPGGIIVLFLIGGCLGLMARWFYKKGVDQASRNGPDKFDSN